MSTTIQVKKMNNAQKRLKDEEEIVEKHEKLIETLENNCDMMCFQCKYTETGILFNFKDNESEDYINLTVEHIEGKENTF